MRRIDKHVYFTPDQIKKIEEYSSKSGTGFSTTVSNMIDRIYEFDTLNEKLSKLQNDMVFLIKKNITLYKLLEQLYSDLDFTNITDVNKSDALKQFNRLLRRGRLID